MKKWDAYYRMKINERLRLAYEKRLQERKPSQINLLLIQVLFFSSFFSPNIF